MPNILGISAFYHDSAACLVKDGGIVAAVQEERFTRKKHDAAFPRNAVEYCMAAGGIGVADLDFVAFYDKPLLKFDRLLETYLAYAPAGFSMFSRGLPLWLKQKLDTPRELDRGLDGAYRGRYVFTEHHEAHAASAFFPSPFDEAAILTLDGVGEWATGSIAVGRGRRIEMVKELRFPHSLGLLYSAFTYFSGFEVNEGEYKLMGLAPYGEPIYRDRILSKLLDLREDGSFRLDMDYFAYGHGDVMTSKRMEALLDGPPRKPDSAITQREMDIAASIQAVTEEIVLRIARHAHEVTRCDKLVLAGGVALNCVANGRLQREGPFRDLWIQPAAGDAGGALGAALFVWHQLLDGPRAPDGRDAQQGSLLGPACDQQRIEAFLERAGARYRVCPDEAALYETVADLIAEGRVVGHVAGRMEFGPRALGNRSILGDARSPTMQSVMNQKTKFRESFRPFAPAVLKEHVHEYFEMREGEDSPYMLLVAKVHEDKRVPVESPAKGFERLKQPRSVVPAVTHVDDSARVQTVDRERHPRLYGIVEALYRKTGCPVVINTSFNVRGEPIVNTEEEAYRCFCATHMDALVLERCVLLKEEQPADDSPEHAAYLRGYRGETNGSQKAAGLIGLDLRPGELKLARFGLIALFAFTLLAAAAWFEVFMFAAGLGSARVPVAASLAALGAFSGACSLLYPRANFPLYAGLSLLTYPIGLLSSRLILALLFFGVFTPIGLGMRLFGRDPLQRGFRPGQSYYQLAHPPRDKQSYFRQF